MKLEVPELRIRPLPERWVSLKPRKSEFCEKNRPKEEDFLSMYEYLKILKNESRPDFSNAMRFFYTLSDERFFQDLMGGNMVIKERRLKGWLPEDYQKLFYIMAAEKYHFADFVKLSEQKAQEMEAIRQDIRAKLAKFALPKKGEDQEYSRPKVVAKSRRRIKEAR